MDSVDVSIRIYAQFLKQQLHNINRPYFNQLVVTLFNNMQSYGYFKDQNIDSY